MPFVRTERLNVQRATYRRMLEDIEQQEEEDLLVHLDAVARPRREYSLSFNRNNGVALTQAHYRRAADSWAVDADGVVHNFNGIDKPRRFEPSVGSYETGGVIAPTAALNMAGRGAGVIVGDFYAYLRFVDRDGNFSSLSPISNPYTASSGSYSVTGATNASPIVITTSASLANGQIVKIKNVLGNTAANGIYSVRRLTASTYELYADSSLSVPINGTGTYVSGGTLTTGVSTISYTNVPISTESRVTRRQILRNQDGDTSVFYIDIDTEDLTSTDFESNTDSISLTNSVSLFDVNGKSLVDKTIPPDYKKVVCFHLGRMFAAGNEPYSEGAVSVTNGSAVITGIGTEWGPITFKGRFFEVVGGTKQYEIAYLTSATSAVLTEAFTGTTDPYAYYSIHVGDGERRTIYWSEASEPEAWPLANTLTLAEDPGAGEITGIMSQRSYVYILSEYRLYRFSFVNDPLLDGFIVKAAQRGCVNNRCWVQVEDVAYMLDSLGIHAFAGNDDQDIGTSAIQDMFRLKPSGKYRINWDAKRNFHAVYSPSEGTIRWFVSLTGNYTPQHAICFHTRLKRWWIEEYPWPVSASCVGRLAGKPQVFLGTNGRRIMASGYSTLDGPDPIAGTVRSTVTSSGFNWISDSAATHASSGLVGNSVTIVRGKGKGQRRTIYSVSGGKITVTQPWLDKPDTTSVYQIGAIDWKWRSGFARWADGEYKNSRAFTVHFKRLENAAEMYLRVYRDLEDVAQDWENPVVINDFNGIGLLEDDPTTDLTIDSTRTKGYVTHRVDAFSDWWTDGTRFVSLELCGHTNDQQLTVFRVGVEGAIGGRQ